MTDPRVDHLRAYVVELERVYKIALEDMYRSAKRRLPPDDQFPPELFKDSNGRYILLDALTALVSAQTALTITERDDGTSEHPSEAGSRP